MDTQNDVENGLLAQHLQEYRGGTLKKSPLLSISLNFSGLAKDATLQTHPFVASHHRW